VSSGVQTRGSWEV